MAAIDPGVVRYDRREFLFLQGLAGPFFSLLGQRLAARGHGVRRVNFNGGDKLFWSLPGAVDYRGGRKGWSRFLSDFLNRNRITDVVLFGDCRPLHRAAILIARRRGVQVHVFEEGYIRPDFVTVEAGGVNGHSSLWRDPDSYLVAARGLPPMPVLPGVPSSFGRRAREDIGYNAASLLLSPLFPGYRTHRPWNIAIEYAAWGWRLLRKWRGERQSRTTLDALAASGRPYFVFPLQLDCDYQIRIHSKYGGMQPAIEHVLSSFAAHAPAETLLVVKGHPLDNGLTNWEARTADVAARLGIAGRVLFVGWADIDPMVRDAAGVVTVNSTTGTLSLRYGVPTMVLGDAVYDIPRITHQGGIDNFWANPRAPEPEVFDAFRRVLIDRCLIHGGYFSDEGLAMLVAGAAARLEAAEPGVPSVRPIAAGAAVRPTFGTAAAAGG